MACGPTCDLDGEVDDNGELTVFLRTRSPIELPCEPTVDPNIQLGMQVHLPILSFLGMDDCDVWIEVQNVGAEPGQGDVGDVGRGRLLPAAGRWSAEGRVHGSVEAGHDVEPAGRSDT